MTRTIQASGTIIWSLRGIMHANGLSGLINQLGGPLDGIADDEERESAVENDDEFDEDSDEDFDDDEDEDDEPELAMAMLSAVAL
jgi:hypothetical protein